MRLPALPQWTYDAAVLVFATAHLLQVLRIDNQPAATFAILGVAALAFRHRFPLTVFAVTIPAAAMVNEKLATLFALYAVAYRYRSPLLPGAAVLLTTCCFVNADQELQANLMNGYGDPILLGLDSFQVEALRQVLYYLLMASVSMMLGYLQRTRHELSRRLEEITEAREHEQRLLTQQVLAAERAQLAREMHDVVSHQVSLIAVQAGALRMQTKDREAKEAASTIRRLSVTTLEELRHMVRVLRASGVKATELAPQPTIAQLETLVGDSGIDASLEIGELPELEPPLQRAVYRTVQEALTNVRKHAPGATASVRVDTDGDRVEVEVSNTAARRPVVDLPSSQYGLMGLRQRAELLGGRLDYSPSDDGGWWLRLRVPLAVTSGAR
ncbi:sensor histidine kinase [Glycomyces arizonensis]|uniref:sensor histidine kinase n=1 Tax=Glycomyces arizonensis TaxID=256035 RepID=UPI000409C81A|nr:histidine kinase [Glycomyces arizonensis]